ncbi:MAG: GntR family transcriptional regulator [Natronosporangium sp.]
MARSGRPQTAQEFALAELRRAIVTGELSPGQPIRQDALAERLGISKVPLREALKMLEGEGQVTYRPHRGYLVTDLSLNDLLEVYRIRELLESEAAREAVVRVGPDDIDRIVAAQRDFEAAHEAGDAVVLTATNRAFHFALLEAAGMPRLVRLVRVLWDATDAYRSVYYNDEANRRRAIREHRAVIKALRNRDADELVRMLNEHRDAAVIALRRVIGKPS